MPSERESLFWQARHMRTGKQPKSVELRQRLGERLLAARTVYHPNRAAVARALGVDHRVMEKYEKGDRYPDEAFIVRFADLTGCPLDFLYRGLITSEMDPLLAAGIAAAAPHLAEEAVEAARASRSKRVAALSLE